MAKPEKLVLIGFDAPIAPRLYEYAVEGHLPNLKRLIEGGVYFENCLVPYPTITPPNWTTIVTGAWPGTHGITCFNMHKPGMPLDQTYAAFDSRDCQAEYLWEAAEREGKLTIILNYPSTWPPRGRNIVQVGGAGLAVNEWRIAPDLSHVAEVERYASWYGVTLCEDMLFSTEEYPLAAKIVVKEGEGWVNLPVGVKRAREARLDLYFPRALYRVKPTSWWLLLLDYGSGFVEAAVCRGKDYETALAKLKVGEWSPLINEVFETERGPVRAAFKIKLLELSSDGSKVKLYVTPIGALSGWSYPEDVASKLEFEDVYPMPSHGVYRALNLGWIDEETFLEVIDMEHRWLAKAACKLMELYPSWSIFIMHAHCPDWAYHAFINKVDPRTALSEEVNKTYLKVELEFYKSLDRMVGEILSKVDLSKTLVVVVSDHGAKPTTHRFNVREVLVKAGLLAYREEGGVKKIDWSRTKAVPQRACYIYVNLKGRDPEGVVEPSEYDKVVDQVIKALYDYTDPETGLKPVLFALRRGDARVLGLYGDRVGDVVFALRPEFGGQHGPFLPTAAWGIGDLRGLLIMAGPGLKRGVRVSRTVWLTDIVPTVCYLMELPIPKDAEGAVIYQALEDPDSKIRELKELRKRCEELKEKYEKLKAAVEAEMRLTHTYFMKEVEE
jgi:predicted AlkP superfamily phosphohydrolase/phosphomutase